MIGQRWIVVVAALMVACSSKETANSPQPAAAPSAPGTKAPSTPARSSDAAVTATAPTAADAAPIEKPRLVGGGSNRPKKEQEGLPEQASERIGVMFGAESGGASSDLMSGQSPGDELSKQVDSLAAPRRRTIVTVRTVTARGEPTSLTADTVSRKIRSAYLRGLSRCYEKLLDTDKAASGAMTIRLEIGAHGRVTTAKVLGWAKSLDDCARRMASLWRFATPKNPKGEPAPAAFDVRLEMKPNPAPADDDRSGTRMTR